jgi:DNA-binding PadR family transcriptional regulator
MPATATAQPSLSLAESLVLCVLCEKPLHGFAIARLLGPAGDLGQIWRVPKPVIYRALQRLEHLGLVTTTGQQPSSHGPVKSPVEVTPAGRQLASEWLNVPASHNRDVRSELLLKLALLDRAGIDAQPLLTAQRAQIIPVAQALRDRLAATAGFERTLALWRYETVSATLRFLDALQARDVAGARASAPGSAARG